MRFLLLGCRARERSARGSCGWSPKSTPIFAIVEIRYMRFSSHLNCFGCLRYLHDQQAHRSRHHRNSPIAPTSTLPSSQVLFRDLAVPSRFRRVAKKGEANVARPRVLDLDYCKDQSVRQLSARRLGAV